MKRIRKFHLFLTVGLALWIAAFPAYFQFSRLGEADFFSTNQIWENPDSEIMPAGLEKKGKILGAAVPSIPLLARIILGESFSRVSFQIPFLSEQHAVLRR